MGVNFEGLEGDAKLPDKTLDNRLRFRAGLKLIGLRKEIPFRTGKGNVKGAEEGGVLAGGKE